MNLKKHFTDQQLINVLDEDFKLRDDISNVSFFNHPTKITPAVAVICLRGHVEGSVNLKKYTFSENDFFILFPDQIAQYFNVSKDFLALHIIMSKRFIDSLKLNMRVSIPLFMHLTRGPVMHLADAEVKHLQDYYSLLKKTVEMTHNPHRLEMLHTLMRAFFYVVNDFYLLRQEQVTQKTKGDELFESFYNLILLHYRDSREVGFYASKLYLTPKYLSSAIKEITGRSAFGWINDYVILEAKSLLKSTGMTIQQITHELNFPNQSFFGKYFKQHTGMSPSQYRG